ncbi:MFS transporter [Candidatus Bathyarchaeota archaeon]|nr:MFS transporter [Candidatus Bathyarchaeota archaeon]
MLSLGYRETWRLIQISSDIAYYGINLNQSLILSRIGYTNGTTPYDTLWKLAVGNIIVQMAGYFPGFILGIFLPDIMGRKRQQGYLSALSACLYAIWAGVSDHTSTGGLITLFTLSQFVLNAGPNITTFLLPVELFPTRVRATAHGIAAAVGKSGAVLTAFSFGTAADAIGIEGVLGLLSGIMALCVACTFLIPETRGCTLEDLENNTLYGGARLGSDSSVEDVGKDAKVPKSVDSMMESKA